MPTARDCIKALVKVDDFLTAEYGNATPAAKKQIDFLARICEALIKELVLLDLKSRTKDIKSLTKALAGSAQELAAMKATVESIVQAGQMGQQALNAMTALLAFV